MNTDKKILIVDDEQSLASMLRLMLISLGYDAPDIVNTSQQAIQHVRNHHTDIILMDIMLNDRIDGIQTAHIIKADFAIPVIFMTGQPSEEIFDRAKDVGSYGYLIKPIREEELWSVLENAFYRVQIECNLEYERNLAQRYFNAAPAIMMVLNSEGEIDTINTMGCQVLGYSAEDLKGMNWFETFVPEKIKNDTEDIFKKMMKGKTGILRFYENEIVTGGGARRIVSWHNMPLRNDTGAITGLLASGQDVTEKRMAEQEIKEKDYQMKAVLKASPVGIALLRERTIVWLNEALMRMTGYDENELIDQQVVKLYESEQEYERLGKILYSDLSSHGFARYETRWIRKNGNLFPCLLHASPLDPEDLDRGVIIASIDMSEPKRIERNLLKTNQMLQLIIYSSPLGIIHVDVEGVVVMWNRAAERIFGWSEKEVMGIDVNDVIQAVDIDLKNVLADVINGAKYIGNEIAVRTNDGTHIYVSVSATPLHDGMGDVLGVLALVEDITEKKRNEAELFTKNQLLSSIVDSAPLAIIAVDTGARVTLWNTAAEDLFQWKEGEVQGRDIPIIPEYESMNLKEHFQNIQKAGGLTSFEVKRRKKDESLVDVNLNVAMLRDPSGRVTGALTIYEDITEKKRSQVLLQESEERYRAMVESFNGFIYMCSGDYEIIFMNERLKDHIGDKEEAGEKCYHAVFGKKDICEWCVHNDVLKGREAEQEIFSHRDRRWYYMVSTPVYHADGRVSCQAMMYDITDRKNAESELLRRYNQVSALSSIYHTMISSESTIEDISSAILEQAKNLTKSKEGYVSEIESAVRKNVIHAYSNGIVTRYAEKENDKLVFPMNENGGYGGLGALTLEDETCYFTNDLALEYQTVLEKKMSSHVKKYLSCPVVLENELVGQICLFNPDGDYTGDDAEATGRLGEYYALAIQRKRFETELARKGSELSELYTNLSEIREQERTEISREIHDELGQQLTALKMDVAWLKKRVDESNSEIQEKTNQMISLIDTTIRTVRRIVSELRPGILDDLGLIPAIEWLCEQARERTGIEFDVISVKEEYNIDDTVTITVFRIIQEAIHNILKHARAAHVSINIGYADGDLLLQVSDDGVGFDPDAVREKKSYGIIGMKERVLALGGTVHYYSKPGEGTRLDIQIPVN